MGCSRSWSPASFKLIAVARRAGLAAKIKRDNEVGARILIVRGNGGKQASVASFLRKSVEDHLADYMFGGPFRIAHFPGGLHGDDAAIRLMKRTDADLILWGEAPRGSRAASPASSPAR